MIGAIDIGGTKIAIGLVDTHGRVAVRSEIPSDRLAQYSVALDYLCRELNRMAAESHNTLEGIGIGLTGRVDPASGCLTENEFLPDWGRRDLAGDLRRALGGMRVAIENDADAAALGEARWGAGRGQRVFLYITVSTGIGGGLVIDGRLYRGAGGWHPEIGHPVISAEPTVCYCGASGCWEQMACGPAMAASYHARGGPAITAAEICERARRGEALAREAIATNGYWLGVGLGSLINLFAPDCIALGGGMMRSWDLFEPHARAVIAKHCGFLVPHTLVSIVPAQLGGDAPLAGAACTWLHTA